MVSFQNKNTINGASIGVMYSNIFIYKDAVLLLFLNIKLFLINLYCLRNFANLIIILNMLKNYYF